MVGTGRAGVGGTKGIASRVRGLFVVGVGLERGFVVGGLSLSVSCLRTAASRRSQSSRTRGLGGEEDEVWLGEAELWAASNRAVRALTCILVLVEGLVGGVGRGAMGGLGMSGWRRNDLVVVVQIRKKYCQMFVNLMKKY